ncbi:hypothetical protein Tco_1464591 [Tanacetum coccineum]
MNSERRSSNKEVVHNTATIDDKSLQSTLKRIGVNEENRFWNWNNLCTVVLQKKRLKMQIMRRRVDTCSTRKLNTLRAGTNSTPFSILIS